MRSTHDHEDRVKYWLIDAYSVGQLSTNTLKDLHGH